ncbi:MAG: Ig-like domain-containing protein, partial [Patescibacteria group bacterium]
VTAASACATSCQFGNDAACPAGQGCGYPGANGLGCCSPRPTVKSTAPLAGATNVCRNTTAEVEFNQPLDPSTVNQTTVHYLNGYSPVDGAMAVRNDAVSGTIVYQPGLLTANRPQSLILDTFVEQAVSGLQNPDFETWSPDTQPVGWDAARAKKSTDLPPGHTGSSVLVDCSTCTAGQAFAAQDIAPAEPVGSRYRLTGWIKVEQPDGVQSGLITQCMNPNFNNCGYDLSNDAPGLSTGNSNGWKKIDAIVTKSANPAAVLHVNCFANPKAKVWCDDLTLTKIPAAPTSIRGQNGVLADVTGTPLTFNTGQNICAINTVAVEPTDDIFTALGEVHSDFKAEAYPAGSAAPIMPVTGKYEWAWDWSSETSTIALVAMTPPAVANPSLAAVTARANGTTMIKAKAKVTKDTLNNTAGREYYGQSRVRVKFCVSPWQFTDASTNCDLTANGCQNFNFDMFYCRDNGATPLPDFSYTGSATSAAPDTLGSIEGVNTTDPTRLKSFFFKESQTSRDTIGLLIFKNDEFLSPSDWFTKRFPLDTGASSTTVAGYPAVKSGTTTYVGVTDYDGAVMRGLMFVFDYNSNNASPETVNIADQMLSAIAFNTNFPNADVKDQVIRDTKRRQDLTSLKLLLDAYQTKNGTYPALASGSYLPGFSTSKWPSWQATLGAELGKTLPLDPTNTFSAECQAPYEAATCWAESTKTFTCPIPPNPPDSHLYGYRAQGNGVDLYTTMEYTGPGSFVPSSRPSNICTAPNSCDCFNYTLRVGP